MVNRFNFEDERVCQKAWIEKKNKQATWVLFITIWNAKAEFI